MCHTDLGVACHVQVSAVGRELQRTWGKSQMLVRPKIFRCRFRFRECATATLPPAGDLFGQESCVNQVIFVASSGDRLHFTTLARFAQS